MTLDQRLQQLRSDRTAGASTLLELAIDIVAAFAEQSDFRSQRDFYTALVALARELVAAQPAMAPMINLAQQVLQACRGDRSPADASSHLQRCLAEMRHQMQQCSAALCAHALTVIPPQAAILTYSNSSAVIAALCHAHDRGHVRRVTLSESRPAFDGRPQASALLQHGIAVTYSVDIGLFEHLPEAQLVVVGADAVFPHGLINKLGTHALAQAAHQQSIPIYSLCTTNKFLPAAATTLLQIAEHPGHEVWPQAPAELDIRNHYFDTTPLDLFSAIICEAGVMSPATLRAHLRQQRLPKALQALD